MARPARVETSEEPVTESITYVPGEGDRPSVVWCGHTFHANVPKDITGNVGGTPRERDNFHLIESVRPKNRPDGTQWFHPTFRIGNSRPKRDGKAEPKTQMEYRAYAIEWIKDPSIEHADALIARLAKDRNLQDVCEVGYDDFQYLATLFMPRLHDLAHGDELNEGQLGQLWLSHGYNTLPW
jgi:hypothetical protein